MKKVFLLTFLVALISQIKAQTISIIAGGNGQGSAATQLNAPQAICFDRSGNLYIADAANNRIQKFPFGSDSMTNGITVAGGNQYGGHAANQLNSPQSVFVDSSGYIYVSDCNNHRVQKFPPNSNSGTNGVTIAGRASGYGNAPNQFTHPYGIYVDKGGNLYVADADNHRVQKFHPGSDSTTNGITVAGGNGPGSAANQLYSPLEVSIDMSGNLYVVDELNSRIQKFPPGSDSATNGITVAGGNGAGDLPNQLNAPSGLYIDTLGNIYVDDMGNSRIQKFPLGSDSSTYAETVAGGSCTILSNGTTGVWLDARGNIYICDGGLNRSCVLKWDPNGTEYHYIYAHTFAGGNGQGAGNNQLYTPTGICANANGNIFVSDYESIRMFPPNSNIDSTWSSATVGGVAAPGGPVIFFTPTGVFVDGHDYVYVADNFNGLIEKYGLDSFGVLLCAGVGPNAVFVNSSGNIFAADGSQSIKKFPPNSNYDTVGIIVAGGNGQGSGANQFNYPASLFIDAYDNLYVADCYNNRIQKFPAGSSSSTAGITVAGGNGQGSGANQLYYPSGVCVDIDGNIFVADTYNNRVQEFPSGSTSATGGVTVAGGSGAGCAPYQLNHPNSLCLSNGNLCILDGGNYRVQAISHSVVTGITNIIIDLDNIHLYPNPNSGSFILQSSGSIGSEYLIYDMIGRIVAQDIISSDKQNIALKGISMGSYTLEIKGSKAIRFVIEN